LAVHHGHQHGLFCGGRDHHHGEYTAEQQADLERVLAFNARLAAAIDAGVDVNSALRELDPDPLRYMWVDEGRGRLAEILADAERTLDGSPRLHGHTRGQVSPVADSPRAARPSVAVGADGSILCCWVEWLPGEGEVLQGTLLKPDGGPTGVGPVRLSPGLGDVHRPTALFATDGTAWVFFGFDAGSGVEVWAAHCADGRWSRSEQVTASAHPSFNQEAAAHADGRVELCWQARHENRFGVYARVWRQGVWEGTELVSEGVEANVWDPTVVSLADGGSAYAWTEYREGTYRVVVRRRDAHGRLGRPRQLTAGTDYALHPSLAVTNDQRLWCAFDLVRVAGHGGSGPTKLRPADEIGADRHTPEGVRAAGESVPPELLPEVSASIKVVEVDEDGGAREPPGVLAPSLNVVPSGLPRLAATPDGGLVVAYRVHRQLPLMTYYWEVAAQVLGQDGWEPPRTFGGSDGTLEEVSIAGTQHGAVIAAQADARLDRALTWTEGFGGRECPYLMEHQGSVVWHGVHGVGTVVLAEMPTAAEAPPAGVPERRQVAAVVDAGERTEARRWVAGRREGERYRARLSDGRQYELFWGDLHRHSLVSRCTAGDEPSLEDFYRYAWDVCEYDFWAVTDHAENSSDYQWWAIQKTADLFHVPERFVPLYGFEWTSPDTGHQNVIFGDVKRGAPIFSAFAEGSTDPTELWASLGRHPDYPAVTIPHHPGSAMVHTDWGYHDSRYLRLVEIFQACRGNYEAPGGFRQYADATLEGTFVIDGLKRGHRFGFVASSDHGHGASYVGAFAESLNRGAVFDALHSRRTFAATTRDIVLDVQMNGAFLGEELAADDRELVIHVEGYTDLARVDVVRNGEVVFATVPDLGLPEGWIAVPLRVEWGQSERTTAWDGELTVHAGEVLQTPYWSPEVVQASRERVAWKDVTRSFGEPYGAQRGGIELTVIGPPHATVSVKVGGRSADVSLGDLSRRSRLELPGEPGRLFVQRGIGGLSSLGAATLDLTWSDDGHDAAFYYVRAFQVDGEMAWSSPIWVTPTTGGEAT
jgi:Protein of unknown function (DUF3604)